MSKVTKSKIVDILNDNAEDFHDWVAVGEDSFEKVAREILALLKEKDNG